MPAFEAITSTTLTSTTASVSFSSIPSSYEHLQIRLFARNSDSATNRFVTMQFNSDTGANYNRWYIEADGDPETLTASTGDTYITVGRVAANTATSNIFGVGIIDIVDYATTNKNTVVQSLCGYENNGAGQFHYATGLWLNTSAVSTITVACSSGSFLSGSIVSLYGFRSS